MVLLGSPLDLAVITILDSQVTQVLSGTFSRTPRATSLSRSALTLVFQCRGTGTTGLAEVLMWNSSGVPVI